MRDIQDVLYFLCFGTTLERQAYLSIRIFILRIPKSGPEPYLFSVIKCKKGNNLGEKIKTSKASDHCVGLSPDHISNIAFGDSTGHLALFAHVNIYPLKFIEGSVQRTLVIILMNSSYPDVREEKDKWKKSVCDTAK